MKQQWLIDARNNMRYTQKDIATLINISEHQYLRIEKGVCQMKLHTFCKLSKILKIKLKDIPKEYYEV